MLKVKFPLVIQGGQGSGKPGDSVDWGRKRKFQSVRHGLCWRVKSSQRKAEQRLLRNSPALLFLNNFTLFFGKKYWCWCVPLVRYMFITENWKI